MLSIAETGAATGTGQSTLQSVLMATPASPQPRLVHAAQEVEGQMMKELLKPLTASNGLDGEEDDSTTGAGGTLGEFASESLAQALSEKGGFGIATSIVRQLSRAGNASVTGRVTTKVHGNTVMKSYE